MAKRQPKPKRIAVVKFQTNGALMEAYLHRAVPYDIESTDVVEVRLTPAPDYDGPELPEGWFMNGYDLLCAQWLMNTAVLHLVEKNIPLTPASMRAEGVGG